MATLNMTHLRSRPPRMTLDGAAWRVKFADMAEPSSMSVRSRLTCVLAFGMAR
jgi:hypothetical protein